MRQQLDTYLQRWVFHPINIAPLLTFRILFGGMMMVGAIRFMYQGWIERLYIEPQFFFKFYGFEWAQPLGETGMYALLFTIIISAGMVIGATVRGGRIIEEEQLQPATATSFKWFHIQATINPHFEMAIITFLICKM